MTNIKTSLTNGDVKSQEKYGFDVQDGKGTLVFGPFDTRDSANKTAAALKETGVTVSNTKVIWTVSTARNLATVRRAKMTKSADAPAKDDAKQDQPA